MIDGFLIAQSSAKQRTYVLVKNVPTSATSEDVRQALRDQTTGLMKVLLLSEKAQPPHRNDGYALALYDSRASAIEAADSGVEINVTDPTTNAKSVVNLVMIPVQHQQVHKLESVYCETVQIEGETINKSDLAVTEGLKAVLQGGVGASGRTVRGVTPRWCDNTRKGLDCPRGTKCKFLHKTAVQTTFAPAPRGGAVVGAKRDATEAGDLDIHAESITSTTGGMASGAAVQVAEHGAVVGPLASAVPAAYRPPCEYVPLSRAALMAITTNDAGASSSSAEVLLADIARAINAAASKLRANRAFPTNNDGKIFVRLDASHGAPTDAPLLDSALIDAIHRQVPKPTAAFNTALDRDSYIQMVLDESARLTWCHDGAAALRLLQASDRVRDAAGASLRRATLAGIADASELPVARLAVMPAYPTVPSPYGTAQVFFRAGAIHATVQRDAFVLGPVCRHGEDATNADEAGAASKGRPTHHRPTIDIMERRAATWLHKFAVSTRIHLGMTGRGTDMICVTVALPYLGECAREWRSALSDAADTQYLPVVALSVRSFEAAANENSLMPPAPLPEGQVRWRQTKSVFSQHLPALVRRWLGV